MTSLAVVGSRTCTSAEKKLIWHWLSKYLDKFGTNLTIVSGGAKGADTYAADFAKHHGLKCVTYLPDWEKHGRSAGFKRNHDIWDAADLGIAFWDGVSKGTAHSFELARKQGKPLVVILTHQQRLGGIK